MGKTKLIQLFISICVYSSILMGDLAHASGDSCMFQVSSDEMPPNIVFLIDNGVMMQQITWHADFDNDVDYTPFEAVESDMVPNGAAGNGFFNENGYAIFQTGGVFYLVPVNDDLTLATKIRLQETGGKGSATWTINDKTIGLPGSPSSTVDADGVKDNAEVFRYSKNYLNWLFFSENSSAAGSPSTPLTRSA